MYFMFFMRFLILSSIYKKHFSIKSKLIIANGYLWTKNQFYKWFFNFFQICRYGFKKLALQSLILNIKQFVKNIQTYDLGALKWKKLGKSQNSLVFQLQFGYYSSFCKTGFPLNMAWKDRSFDAHIDIFEGKNTTSVFYHKRPFAIVNFDFSEKCLL